MIRFLIFIIILIANISPSWSQTTISGQVLDENKEAIIGANVFLQGTYDGTSTDIGGHFSFVSSEKGTQVMVVSYISYQTIEREIVLDLPIVNVSIVLQSDANELQTVVITAGAFEASDEKKAVVLRPLDIVTTASASGDIVGALETLPGAQKIGEDGRLFVRGGAAYETRTFIDGLYVAKPYSASVPNIASRGRFSPFLFKGITFSTGGYSAEYGQALSSALILETQDIAAESLTAVSIMTVGLSASRTKVWDNTSVSVTADYTDLSPYYFLIPQETKWDQAPRSGGGQLNFRHKTNKGGMFKVQGQYQSSSFQLQTPNPNNVEELIDVELKNGYTFANASYTGMLGDQWSIKVGIAATNHNDLTTTIGEITDKQQSYLAKVKLSRGIKGGHLLKIGAEYWQESFEESLDFEFFNSQDQFTEKYTATFVEADWLLGKKWAVRTGLRVENSQYLNQNAISPRLSIAYKIGDNSQINGAAGRFLQSPESRWQFQTADLKMEEADHYLLNWQWQKTGKLFRAEVFYKKYNKLVTITDEEGVSNGGFGYARGLDVFLKDKVSIKNSDFWLSYSYLDTEREFDYFTEAVQPTFAARHSFSVVYKYWIPRWNMLVGMTASYSSSRPYDNPNVEGFNTERTSPYRDLSMNMSYLTQIGGNFTILYCSATNIPGFNNNFGQEYSQSPNSEGNFSGLTIKPQAKRFLFVGLFVSIGQKLEDNLGG